MHLSHYGKLVGIALLAAVAAAAQSSNGGGNAFIAGPGTHGATLNGAALLPGTSVLGGETVTTASGGVAVLAPTHGAGGVIEMAGAASATVRSGSVNRAAGSDQLQITTGNALVTGQVSVLTPQGATFKPDSAQTSYVVNASATQSSMGVLSGAVSTISLSQSGSTVVPAGSAVQVDAGTGNQFKLSSIKIAAVTKPTAGSAVPQTTVASQSQ